jgi:TrmH family RNA methyltransferase
MKTEMPRWRNYTSLLSKKGRLKEKKVIIEGIRMAREALFSMWPIESAFITESFSQKPEWAEFNLHFQQKNISFSKLNEKSFNRLSETEHPQGILLIAKIPDYSVKIKKSEKLDFVLLLHDIHDPGNMGTIIRTADWFNVNAIFSSQDCVEALNSKVIRSSMGSIFRIPVIEVQDLREKIGDLKNNHFTIVSSSLKTTLDYRESKFKKPVALILGSEATGVTPEIDTLSDVKIKIRKYGKAESLNVALAGAILLNHLASQIYEK